MEQYLSGQCLCGAVKYELQGDIEKFMIAIVNAAGEPAQLDMPAI